jgi:hypothetical protein
MIDDEWLRLLGRAVLYFSFVETSVISIVSSMSPMVPSYMELAMNGKKTAGSVAKDFKRQAETLPEGPRRSQLEQLAIRFAEAVVHRNDMLHAMPFSLGDQAHLARLTREKFVVWSTTMLTQVATEFEKLADDLSIYEPGTTRTRAPE